MKNPLLVPEFREMLAADRIEDIIEFSTSTAPSVAADFLGALTPGEIRTIFVSLEPERRSRIFSYLDDDVKEGLSALFHGDDLVDLIALMHDEQRLGFIRLIPVDRQRDIMGHAFKSAQHEARELAREIDQILKAEYPEEEKLTMDELMQQVRPLITMYRLEDGKIRNGEFNGIEKECWLNIVNPPRDDLPLIARYFDIPLDFLTSALDIDETARIEIEDGATLIILKIPFFDENTTDVPYFTLPVGIILTCGLLITVCAREETTIGAFIENRARGVTTLTGARFILQFFFRATMLFLQYLKQINNAANVIQKKLEQESKNKQLIKLMNLEKSLVYFNTSLKTNELMLERLLKLDIIPPDEDTANLIEDNVIEIRQAIEMANIYSDILSGMMDAFASVISNNLNIVIKFLTSVTIIATIPGTVAAFYGMNVRLPFQEHPNGFLFVLLVSLFLAIIAIIFFLKKKWL